MRIDWSLLFTLFLAIVLARIFEVAVFNGRIGTSTQVSAKVQSPAEPVVVYENPIKQFIAEHYPNAL